MNWTARDAAVIEAIDAAWAESIRPGSWKCHDRIRPPGHPWNHQCVHPAYRRMKLNLPRRARRRLDKQERQPLFVEPVMTSAWAPDFMRDTL